MTETTLLSAYHALEQRRVRERQRTGAEHHGGTSALKKPPHSRQLRPFLGQSEAVSVRLPSPQKAIRLRCLECQETLPLIAACEFGPGAFNECPLWPFRLGRGAGRKGLLKAIRRYCLWCCCGSPKEVRLCPSKEFCALWPYRFGHRPKATDGNGQASRRGA